jgi:hypothetical protein
MIKENLEDPTQRHHSTPHYCYTAFRFRKKQQRILAVRSRVCPLYIMQLVAQPTESGPGLYLFARQYLSDWTYGQSSRAKDLEPNHLWAYLVRKISKTQNVMIYMLNFT